MNTTACIRLDAQELFLDEATPSNSEAGRLVSTIQAGLDAACAETEWPAFKSRLRCHGPEMREAIEKLWELPPPPGASDDREDLSDLLLEQGVSEARVDCVEHAARTMLRAHSVVHLLDEHCGPKVDTNYIQRGDLAVWMYRFARMVLWQIAYGKIPVDTPCLSFAVTLAVDEARDAYACYASALELSEGTAA